MATQFVAHALLLQKDQIHHYAPSAPICVAPQDIAHKVQVAVDSDSHERNWQVARDAVRPKCWFAETVPTDGLARTQKRAEKRIGAARRWKSAASPGVSPNSAR